MALSNLRQGVNDSTHVLFFDGESFGCDRNWGTATRTEPGRLCIEFVEERSGKDVRVRQWFDVAALRQLIDWAKGKPFAAIALSTQESP